MKLAQFGVYKLARCQIALNPCLHTHLVTRGEPFPFITSPLCQSVIQLTLRLFPYSSIANIFQIALRTVASRWLLIMHCTLLPDPNASFAPSTKFTYKRKSSSRVDPLSTFPDLHYWNMAELRTPYFRAICPEKDHELPVKMIKARIKEPCPPDQLPRLHHLTQNSLFGESSNAKLPNQFCGQIPLRRVALDVTIVGASSPRPISKTSLPQSQDPDFPTSYSRLLRHPK